MIPTVAPEGRALVGACDAINADPSLYSYLKIQHVHFAIHFAAPWKLPPLSYAPDYV
jgi:hypothetical protein